MNVEVRRLTRAELALAPPLLAPEGWAFEPAELARLHALGGATGAFDGERLVGFLSFVDTPPYRWIGNVAVAPETRGHGVGAALVEEAIRDAPRAALYSVEKAVPLYARAGFVATGHIQAMRADAPRRAPSPRATSMRKADLREVCEMDARVTHMDRAALLRSLFTAHPDHARVVRDGHRIDGFVFVKAYADVAEIGPLVAEAPDAAGPLLDAALADSTGPAELAGPEGPLLDVARARGFAPTFRPTVMFRGAAPSWKLDAYHAVAGLEKG